MKTDYYVVKDAKGFFELRQTRYKETFYDKGLNHPDDVVAVAGTVTELKKTVQAWGHTTLSGIMDFSLVADEPGTHCIDGKWRVSEATKEAFRRSQQERMERNICSQCGEEDGYHDDGCSNAPSEDDEE